MNFSCKENEHNSGFSEDRLQNSYVDLSVVIPAFNEEANIPVVVEESIAVLKQRFGDDQYELILVNDGSTDSTGRICDELSEQYRSISVLHHPGNRGLGAALKTGFINAKGKLVSFIPGDGQFPIDQVVKLYEEIGEADIIISARQNYQTVHVNKFSTFYRGCLSSMARYLMMWIVGFDLSGKEGSFMIRNEVLQKLRLTSSTGVLIEETLMQCYSNGLTIKESTITVKPRMSGQSKVTNISTYFKTLWEILKLRFKERGT
jgi:glycosyltransferase involved in cell wall biosynthesis